MQKNLRSKVAFNSKAELAPFAEGLADFCDEIQPDLVVMGLSGKDALTKLIVGSNTIKIIHDLKYPVLVIPPKASFKPVVKIGFACDFKQVVETTPVQFIKQMVKEFGAELHILNVDYKNKNFKPDTPEQSFLLHNMLEDVKPQYHFINCIDTEDGINEFAETNNLDLVITIPKKHKLLEGIFKPSSTKKLVFQSHIPVMCLHE